MNEHIEDRLTDEEIYLICGEDLTNEYDLTNMYSVYEKAPERECPDCGLGHTDENEGLFYSYKYTRCIQCSRRYTRAYAKQHRQQVNTHSKKYRLKRKKLDNYGEY